MGRWHCRRPRGVGKPYILTIGARRSLPNLDLEPVADRPVALEPGHHLGGLTSGGLGATDIGNKNVIGGIAREFWDYCAWCAEPVDK